MHPPPLVAWVVCRLDPTGHARIERTILAPTRATALSVAGAIPAGQFLTSRAAFREMGPVPCALQGVA